MKIVSSKFKVNSNGTFGLKTESEKITVVKVKKSITEKLRNIKREKGQMCEFCSKKKDLSKVMASLENIRVINVCSGCIDDLKKYNVKFKIFGLKKEESMENIRILLFNECDSVATNKNEEETIKWYRKEYDLNDDEIEVEEQSLENKMWYYGHLSEEKEKEMLEKLNDEDGNTEDNYMHVDGEIYELMSFEEVLKHIGSNENYYPFIIASTEW